jgi:hypothetical protein
MGVMCETCRKVLFVGTWHGITPSERDAGLLKLACKPPCPAVREFRKDELRPYRVSNEVFRRGYAETGEYEPLKEAERQAHITDARAE